MKEKRDYYEILGVSRNAGAEAIKRAYRKLAKKYHPDTNSGRGGAGQRFQEVTEAYGILGDPEKRKLYDALGHGAFQEGSAEGTVWEGFWTRRKERGENLQAGISISLEEAARGCRRLLCLRKEGGEEILEVRIPAGVDTGQKLRLKGKGEPGLGGGEPGDLLIEIAVREKPGFERKGRDVYTTAEIPFITAALGGEAEIETLYGRVRCRIREGTQAGTKLRLRGKGIASWKDPSLCGDQYVTLRIQVPR